MPTDKEIREYQDIAIKAILEDLSELKGLTTKLNWVIKKGRKLSRRMKIHGMDISIETDKGEERHWYDPHSDTNGTTKMRYPYGYIRRTDGEDGEQIDLYVGPNPEEETVYVIHQNKAPDFKKYDEDKVMIGFESAKDAKQAYLTHYNNPKFFGSMDTMTIGEFKDSFVNKALPPPQKPMQQGQQPMMDPMLMFDPYDMLDIRAVESMLKSIGTMGDKELDKASKAIWGDGYEYVPITQNHIRAEIRGFLQDQTEWLKLVNPMMLEQDPTFTPDKMPHSSDSSLTSIPGNEGSEDLLREQNLDGMVSPEETSSPSNRMDSSSEREMDIQSIPRS